MPPQTNHSYYNFDPVMFTLFDKAGTTYLRYHYSFGGAVTDEAVLACLKWSGIADAQQKLNDGQFPIRLRLTHGRQSLHITLRRMDSHGYLKGVVVLKYFGFVPVGGNRANIRRVSFHNFLRDLKSALHNNQA